jgi:outer membrane protein OmpA-like peptidoglycan-associated protein
MGFDKVRWTLGIIGVLGTIGCAHSYPPPQELTDARVAFERASKGPAAQVNPARFQLAKEALEDAEVAYGAKPEEDVRDRAYVALRRIQAAEAEAGAELASQRRWKALRELATLQGTYADKARAELAAAEGRAVKAEGQLGEEQARTQVAQQQAEAERQARLAAEAKANAALTELTHMATVKREQRGLVITLSGQVLFASNEATLLPAATKALDNVVSALKAVPANAGRVVIEGHTDSRGARAYNRDLAERRARSVRDYLVSRGLPGDLFAVEGVGPDRPVADNRSAEGRANNRRVEIVLPPPAFASTTVGTTETTTSTTTVTTPAPAATATTPAPTTTLPGQNPAPSSTVPQPPRPTSTPPMGPPPSAPTPLPGQPPTPTPYPNR